VVGRELREATRRRTFWIVVALAMVVATVGVVLPEIVGGDRDSYTVATVEGSDQLDAALRSAAATLDVDLELDQVASIADGRQLVEDEDVDVVVVGGDDPEVIARAGESDRMVGAAQQVVATQALAGRMVDAGLSPDQAGEVLDRPSVPVDRLNADQESRRGSAVIVSIAVYLLLLMLTIQVANGTAIEKANRISEVLLAIVRPGALLFGKVIGVGVIGILTLLAGLLPVLIKFGLGGSLPAGLPAAIGGGAAWFVLGVALYLTMAGALGALVERQEEAGTAMAPLTMVLVASYLVGQAAADTTVGQVLAIFPLSSPLVMPPRIATGAASSAEMAVSLVLLVATLVLVGRVVATVYRRAIVRTGRRLRVREALRAA
jgi:ABC-2 type transport system permease protein